MKKNQSTRSSFCEPLEIRTMMSGWTALTNRPAAGIGTMMLLPNGTVMAVGAGVSNAWYSLKPDATGSYANGTWTTLAPMSLQRLYFASNVLPDGRVFVLGGEYSGPSGTANWTNTGEIYNPVTNSWSAIPNMPETQFGDVPSTLLPDGRVLVGSLSTASTYIYNPTTNLWSAGPTKLNSDRSDEESWVKLNNNEVLSYNIFGNNPQGAQRYIPTSNSWINSGNSPVVLQATNSELGPALRLPDGRVFYAGATNHNAVYTPDAVAGGLGTWAAAPDTPGSLGANDAPGAILPNGHIIYAAGPTPTFASPTSLFDYDPTANTITAVSTTGGPTLSSTVPYITRMLMLPTGQMLYTTSGNQLYTFNPDGAPSDSWRPTISNVTGSGGTYTLTGTQINGLSEGSSYGDDAESSSNYPIIRLTDASGVVSYARTFNWSNTGVATGSTPVTTQFVLPTGVTAGAYKLAVIANGIASKESLVVFEGGSTLAGGATLKLDPSNASNVAVYHGASPFASFPLSSVTAAFVVGDSAADVTEVDDDLSGLAIAVSGGGGSDQLVVRGNYATGANWFASASAIAEPGRLNLTYGSDVGPISLTLGSGADTLSVSSSSASNPLTLLPNAGNDQVITGAATSLTLSGSHTLSLLTIGGTANLPANGNSVVRATSMSVQGRLDIANNTIIYDYTGASPLSSVRGYLASGRNGGAWNGSSGIVSSSVAALVNSSLGYAEASAALGVNGGTFAGQTVDNTAVLIRFTYLGDTNLDRKVDIVDLGSLSGNWQSTTGGWAQGDFDYSGKVDIVDLGSLSGDWQLVYTPPAPPDTIVTGPSKGTTITVTTPITIVTPPTKTSPTKGIPVITPITVIPPPMVMWL